MAPASRRGRLLSSIAAVVAVVIVLLGLAGVLRSARATAVAPLLPRLEAETPDGFYLETNAHEIEGGNRLLLKFNGYIHNGGQGAVDVRGSRGAPKLSGPTQAKVKQDEEKEEETLEAPELKELATPEMEVTQREFLPVKEAKEELEINRTSYVPHSLPSAELLYSASDGHDHWHLQHVAEYWLETKEEHRVSTGQKVGFCLDDSEHRDETKGPSTPAYADQGVTVSRKFCQQYKPETTEVFEGISPGWSDLYGNYLAWQWVDVSKVVPGEYQIAEQVDPEGGPGLAEEEGGKKTSTSLPVTVPGYDAEPVNGGTTEYLVPKLIPLKSRKWVTPKKSERENPESHKLLPEPGSVEYVVAKQPEHGHVTIPSGGTSATYTPEAGFSGADHFTYVAKDHSSEFPKEPVAATVTITVGAAPPHPEVRIERSPSGLTTSTTGALEAKEVDDTSGIVWSTSAGSIKSEGNGEKATLTAPSTPQTVTVTASLKDGKASTPVSIPVTAPAPAEPAPSVPVETPQAGTGTGNGGVAGTSTHRGLSHPRAMLFGHRLVITTTPYGGGRIKVEALVGKHALGACEALTPANRQFTCHIKLPPKLSLKTHIAVVATLKEGSGSHELFTSKIAARVIPQMKMVMASSIGSAAAARIAGFWCSPSMLVPTLSNESASVTRPAVPSRPRRLAQ
jgi:hypothetical protein